MTEIRKDPGGRINIPAIDEAFEQQTPATEQPITNNEKPPKDPAFVPVQRVLGKKGKNTHFK